MTSLDRRGFLGALKAGAGLAEMAALEGPNSDAAGIRSGPGKKPMNVLLLMSDQHRHEALELLGDTPAKTPNLDALARSGLRFDHAYCTDPMRVPSRASLLTGPYPHEHKTYNNSTPWPFKNKTIAHAFDLAGYTILEGDFKHCYYVDDIPELYNLRTDPQEMKNLALLSQYESKVREMKSKLFAWYRPPQARSLSGR